MESIKKIEDISNLKDNKIIGNPNLIYSEIKFNGQNNILVCDGDIRLRRAKITFQGNNSIVYLSHTKYDYNLNIFIRSNSTIFFGKNNKTGFRCSINIQEQQNLIIGDEGIIGNDVTIRTCDAHAIYDLNNKRRINFSDSIFIGDHVWIDHFSYISRGVKIGSGAIIGVHSFLEPSVIVHSNNYVMGNPIKVINDNVFFTGEFTGDYDDEDTLNFSTYKSDIFHYKFTPNETLSVKNIDAILKDLTVDDRREFIEKLFIKNKRKNRFFC